jgi:hypothetical protein
MFKIYLAASMLISVGAFAEDTLNFSYDGTRIEGRVAAFDILGVKLNMPYRDAVTTLAKQGYVCKPGPYKAYTFQQLVQIKSRRTGEKPPLPFTNADYFCIGPSGSDVAIVHIPTPSGFRVKEVRVEFNSNLNDTKKIEQQIVQKYGPPNQFGGYCDKVDHKKRGSNFTHCLLPSLYFAESGPHLSLYMPQTYQEDIDNLIKKYALDSARKSKAPQF